MKNLYIPFSILLLILQVACLIILYYDDPIIIIKDNPNCAVNIIATPSIIENEKSIFLGKFGMDEDGNTLQKKMFIETGEIYYGYSDIQKKLSIEKIRETLRCDDKKIALIKIAEGGIIEAVCEDNYFHEISRTYFNKK